MASTSTATPTEGWSTVFGALLSSVYLWTMAWLVVAMMVPVLLLGWQPVVISSGSMQPVVRPGDVVLLSAAGTPTRGQVITYRDPAHPERWTTHRVVRVEADGSFRTQGDANARPDSTPVPAGDVVGRGSLLVPLVGMPMLWLRSDPLLLLVWAIVTVAALLVAAGRREVGTSRPVLPGRIRLARSLACLAVGIRLAPEDLARRLATFGGRRTGRPTPRPVRTPAPLANSFAAVALSLVVGLGGALSASSAAYVETSANVGSDFAASASFPSPAPGECSSGSSTFLAVRDATIDSGLATTNLGTATTLLVRGPEEGSGTRRRILVGFDLTAVPAGAIIESATLELNQTAQSATRTLSAHRVTAAWSETAVTWATAPSFLTSPEATTTSSATPGWRSWNVLSVLDLTQPSFLVKDRTENGDDASTQDFASREAGTAPRLTIAWRCELHLHDDPEGSDSASQAMLPLTVTAPVATTLPNYDTDRDAFAGLLVSKGAVGVGELDGTKIQRWSRSLVDDLVLDRVRLEFHSATKNFNLAKVGHVTWFLRDCAAGGTACTELGSATVTRADWQGGSSNFVVDVADFGTVGATVASGRELHLAVIVDGGSGDDHWFAYGTTSHPTRLILENT